MGFNSPDNKLASLRSKRCSIEDLQIKYEAPSPAKTSSRWKKSKVKQLSCLFNTKISQIIKREGDVGKYTPLINEFSPEAKTQPIQKCPKLEPMPRKKFIKPKAPVPTPRKKVIANMQTKSSACFVPEDVFSKLSVKDKALFYTKFVEEMTKKNPKFGVMESQGNRIINKSEVIEEKQVSVKNLLDELEFNSVFPKPTAVAANAIQRMDSMKRACAARRRSLQMSKEFEDILQQQETTIQTQCTSLTTSSANETSSSSSSANNDQNQTIFQNVQIETLFYSWLKEKHDNDVENMENEAEIHDDEKQKTIIDTLLEEAIAQLETEETAKVPIAMPRKLPIAKLNDQTESPSISAAKAPEDEAQANLNDNSPSISAAKTSVAEAQANPNENSSSIAAGKTSEAKAQAKLSDNSTSTSSAKPSETEESESGVSSLPKITSEESQPENPETKTIKSENSFEFAKPLVPARKKKLRRNTVPKKDASEKEVPQTTSTDSDSGGKQTEAKLKNKKLTSPIANRKDNALHYEEQPCLEMNQSFFKSLNSPRKIKSVYTLTINDLDTPVCTPRSSLNLAKQQRESGIFTVPTKKRTLSDSLTDQGFETATNDAESSLKKTVLQETAETQTPLSSSLNAAKEKIFDNKTIHVQESTKTDACSPAKTTVVQEKAKTQAPAAAAAPTTLNQTTTIKAPEPAPAKVLEKTASLDKIDSNSSKYSMVYSTPIKTPEQHTFTPKRLFSPIVKAMKNRRKSFYDIEARRSSLAMQVIREDQPLETLESQQPNNRYSNAEQELFAKPSTIKYANNFKEFPKEKISQFWIKCGDFSVSLDIDYVGNRRLQTLYEIFSQNNDDTKDLHFGIDNNKFSIHEPLEMDNISTRIPSCQECSHYWFSTGELTIPFNGKILPPHKIQRLFRALKETVLETGVLRFGVDAIEFSSVPEFWYQQAKFSVGSQYNMLVGLQSGDSDGLEGRSKYAWPHTKPVMISDLDHSDIETDNYEDDDYAHFSFHPFASNHFDLAALGETELAIPRNSVAMMNLETYCGEYENEPLDQLFDDKCHEEEEEQEEVEQPAPEQAEIKSVPHMIHVMENEKQRLSDVKAQLSNCAQSSSYIAKDALDAYKGTPAYVEKLKDIVADISNIVCSNNIDACSIDELENYLYFLSRYAEICLSTCDKHIDTVLSALVNCKEIMV